MFRNVLLCINSQSSLFESFYSTVRRSGVLKQGALHVGKDMTRDGRRGRGEGEELCDCSVMVKSDSINISGTTSSLRVLEICVWRAHGRGAND